MNREIIDLALMKNIENYIKNNLRYIKSVDEISFTNFTIKNEPNNVDYEKSLYEELYFHKKHLQLILNIYNNFGIYKDFQIKDIKKMTSLKDFYDYGEENEGWKCINRLDKKILEQSLYGYIYCSLSIKKIYFRKCAFCFGNIPSGERKCQNCNTSIEDLQENMNLIPGKMDHHKLKNTEERLFENTMKKTENKYREYWGKWRCAGCESGNDYSERKCEVCDMMFEEGSWFCRECFRENNGKERLCGDCKKENVYLKQQNNLPKSPNFKITEEEDISAKKNSNKSVDQWRCGKCECLNKYTFISCMVCEGIYREGNWTCGGCMEEENDCDKDTCRKCGRRNVNMKETEENIWKIKDRCDKCDSIKNGSCKGCIDCYGKNKSKIEYKEKMEWKCRRCEYINKKGGEEKCGVCDSYKIDVKDEESEGKREEKKLSKDNYILVTGVDEEEHKISTIEKKVDTWKCGECGYYNEYSFLNCIVCGGMFEKGKWICGGCKENNDCGKITCLSCGKKNIYKTVSQERTETVERYGSIIVTQDKIYRMVGEKDEVKIGQEQWKCAICGLLQCLDLEECSACGESRMVYGLWKCGPCSAINKCQDAKCLSCLTTNVRLNAQLCRLCKINRALPGKMVCLICKRQNITQNCWLCGKCGSMDTFNCLVCKDCGGERKVNGLWKCDKCPSINMCANPRCESCRKMNSKLTVEVCRICKYNHVIPKESRCIECIRQNYTDDRWQCQISHCKEKNVNCEYCKKCKVWRNSSHYRGGEVIILLNNAEQRGWICSKCQTFNTNDISTCRCKATRH